MTKKKSSKSNFENLIKELESIVNFLEQGDGDLDESLSLFTRGMGLVKKCQQLLNASEQKIKILIDDQLTDFSATQDRITADNDPLNIDDGT